MASASLNLSGFSSTELTVLLTAAKAEMLVRLTGGSLQSGSSAGQSYSMNTMTTAELVALINSLTGHLGYDTGMSIARPNFSSTGMSSDPYRTV